MATSCPATLLLFWTLAVVVTVLCTHGCPLGLGTAAWLHYGNREKILSSGKTLSYKRLFKDSLRALQKCCEPDSNLGSCCKASPYMVSAITQCHPHQTPQPLMFTCVGGDAFMPTAVMTAFLVVGTVTVIGAELRTHSCSPSPARTHSWLPFGNTQRVSSSQILKIILAK